MRQRVARFGSLLAAGVLLGSVALAVPAAAQQQGGLEVGVRGAAPSPGKLRVTAAMSGPAWGAGERLEQDDFSAWMNGRPVPVTKVSQLQDQEGSRGKVSVILAVDTSGSMADFGNIVRARAAANAYAAAMKPGTRMGVVAFSTRPRVAQGLTSDQAKVQAAINGLQADGNTALNDAIGLASRLLAKEDGQRNLVVLSDGRDDGSVATRKAAIAAATKAGVIVDTVGLNVPGRPQDQAALREISQGTGGQWFEANDGAALERRLGELGQTLASQYDVELDLPPGLGRQVDFRLKVQATRGSGEYRRADFPLGAQASPPAAQVPDGPLPAPALSRLEGPQGRYVIAVVGFATILLACLLLFGPRSRGGRPYRALRQRLSPYSLTPAIADDQPRLTAFGSSEWAGRATAMAETLVRRGNLEETFLDRLEAAGLNMRVAEFVLISLGSAFIPPLLVLVVTRNLLLTVVVVLLGVIGPFVFLAVLASRRRAKFDEQLPATLQLLAGALQAGHSLQQAVDTVVHEAGDPIAGEFQRVLTEARLGRPLEEALEAMAKRTGSVDFGWTVMAIRLQRQVGGNLAEVLSTVSQTIRDRYSLKRQIKALSAEGRLSSLILSILPFLLFAALLLLNPQFLRPLYTTGLGIMMMAGSAVLMILGVIWLRKITEIKV
jgi:tight adherence protein B